MLADRVSPGTTVVESGHPAAFEVSQPPTEPSGAHHASCMEPPKLRDDRDEAPVLLCSTDEHAGPTKEGVIGWGMPMHSKRASSKASVGDRHQADMGAGAQTTTSGPLHELSHIDDPVVLIGVDLHNECTGPFLARAFARCCQLYIARHYGLPQACSSNVARPDGV
eukprot:NODE_11397_length_1289_cov_7.791738.p2 GENE.NODE_11397_length_1289_cov_7.791738~~NODE_11397_length_1289_cov_7.791738.p2  ORF type:complete len:166 (+),score=18.96 NODE_11397_length_1289_cov_7.791738:541-1038(+)